MGRVLRAGALADPQEHGDLEAVAYRIGEGSMEEKSSAKAGLRHWAWVASVVLLGALLYLVLVGPRL